jgi:hypothetical protein
MNLLPLVRKRVIRELWRRFRNRVPAASRVAHALAHRSRGLILDHLALQDLLPGPGDRHELAHLLECMGFVCGGRAEIPAKSTTFEWFEEEDAGSKTIWQALPQFVLALPVHDGLAPRTRAMLERMRLPAYPGLTPTDLVRLGNAARTGDTGAATLLFELCRWELARRPHRLPTLAEYETLRAEQPLLGWCALHARAINHFAIAVYACPDLNTLDEVHDWLTRDVGVHLNHCQGRTIQGGPAQGLAQSATVPTRDTVRLDGGTVTSQGTFLELVWRYREKMNLDDSAWGAYFRGYVGQNADPIAETISEG